MFVVVSFAKIQKSPTPAFVLFLRGGLNVERGPS
jgi:hypothetical protein